MKNNLDIITDSGHEKISLVLKSLIVGIITSLVVILYRFSLSYAEKIAFNIYEYISENKWAIPLWFLVFFIIFCLFFHFNCDFLVRQGVYAKVDRSKGAFSDFLLT